MAELRRLIIGDEDQNLAEALPRAVTLRVRSDRQLGLALEPLLADMLGDVARKHPDELADALQPMIGRAVRKAVSGAFAALLQRVNQALEHTLSIRSLRWRLEAARTGRPYAEICLLRSLVFRVEQIFLVHRRTGLLLAYASVSDATVSDPDQVAAMISVIEKFARDAFREGETLTRFEVGDLQARTEVGAEAAITAVVRGTPPEELGNTLRDALERIHAELREPLLSFGGDTAAFEPAQEILAACLLEQRRERSRRSRILPIAIALVVVLVSALGIRAALASHAAEARLASYEQALRAQSGLVVTRSSRDGDRYQFEGLRDPLAPDPAQVLAGAGADLTHTSLRFEPFVSSHPRIVEERVRAALAPPTTAALAFDDGVVRVTGVAPRAWLARARMAAGLLPGVRAVEASAVREQESIAAVAAAASALDGASFAFTTGSAALDARDDVRLDVIARELAAARAHAQDAGVEAQLSIDGYADTIGSSPANVRLAAARAGTVRAALHRRGIPDAAMTVRAVGERPGDDARQVQLRLVLRGLAADPGGAP